MQTKRAVKEHKNHAILLIILRSPSAHATTYPEASQIPGASPAVYRRGPGSPLELLAAALSCPPAGSLPIAGGQGGSCGVPLRPLALHQRGGSPLVQLPLWQYCA
jgi:hypothetical protein